MGSIISVPAIEVYYVKSENGTKGASSAFDKLESQLSTLKGRKFYGVIYGKPPEDDYYACVALEPEDELKPLPFKKRTIPGGSYAQQKIVDWSHTIPKFSETFRNLKQHNNIDSSRPFIEFYRSMREVLCRVPIVED